MSASCLRSGSFRHRVTAAGPARVALPLLLMLLGGCHDFLRSAQSPLMRVAMASAYSPKDARAIKPGWPEPLRLWAGDLHFHVRSPLNDLDWHRDDGQRSFDDAMQLLRRSRLDFVALTPHLYLDFCADRPIQLLMRRKFRSIRLAVAAEKAPLPLIIWGAEYTDTSRRNRIVPQLGHVGLLFADVDALLEGDMQAAALKPDLDCLQRLAASDALLVLHHPLITNLRSWLPMMDWDMSWRALTSPSRRPRHPAVPFLNTHYNGLEVYNVVASHLRDRLALHDPLHSARETLAVLDRQILQQKRRLIPTGGSDSHDSFTRSTVFVAAPTLTEQSLRDALRKGRVCVRAPDPCALSLRADDAPQRYGVGDAVTAKSTVSLSWPGTGTLFMDGKILGDYEDGVILRIAPDGCHLLRLQLGGGFSAPVYLNCPFAAAER